MEDNKQLFECQECGAEGGVTTDMDLVAEFCPFCGEPLDDIEWNNYASLATNSCKHIRRYHIQKCLFDLGYGIEVKCTTLEPHFGLDK